MAVPAGPYVGGEIERLGERLRDVASLLYDLDQSSSLAVLDTADSYVGRTREVLGDVAADKAWLWPTYTAVRERVEFAASYAERKDWDEARTQIATPLDLDVAPPHDDLPGLVETIADTAKALVEVALLVAPRIGEHLGALSEARSALGRLDEEAAGLGLSQHPTMQAAHGAVGDAFETMAKDPLGTDPTVATAAVERARLLVEDQRARFRALRGDLDAADLAVIELEMLIRRGREAIQLAREKVAHPDGLLVPMDPSVVTASQRGLRPWLDRLIRAHAEGDVRAALVGMASWQKLAADLRAEAERIAQANEAPVARRDELRGLLTALRAKAAASGFAEDPEAQRLHDEAKALLWVAPSPLDEAQELVDAYRRYLATR